MTNPREREGRGRGRSFARGKVKQIIYKTTLRHGDCRDRKAGDGYQRYVLGAPRSSRVQWISRTRLGRKQNESVKGEEHVQDEDLLRGHVEMSFGRRGTRDRARREAEHPGEPTARYARHGATIPAFPPSLPLGFSSLLAYSLFFLSLFFSSFSFVPFFLFRFVSVFSLSSPIRFFFLFLPTF